MQQSTQSIRMTFSRNLGEIARARGISHATLARRSGRSRSHLLEVLAGRRGAGIDCVADFAWAVEVDCGALFRDDALDVIPPPLHVRSTMRRKTLVGCWRSTLAR